MEKIIFAVDLSDSGLQAFCYALRLAQVTGVKLSLLHLHDIPEIFKGKLPEKIDEIIDLADQEDQSKVMHTMRVLKRVAKDKGYPELSLDSDIKHGQIIPGLINFTLAKKVDLLVIGDETGSKFKANASGSITAKIVEALSVPLLAVPPGASIYSNVDKIAYTTDFGEDEIRVLEMVIKLAKVANATLQVLNLNTVPKRDNSAELAAFRAHFDYPKLEMETLPVRYRDREKTLVNYLKAHGVDILTMMNHRSSPLDHLLDYDLARKLSHELEIPLYTFQPNGPSQVVIDRYIDFL